MAWNLRRKGGSGVLDITSQFTAGSAAWARLVRSGDVVDFYINNWNGTGVPANEAIMTLPVGFRPAWARRLTSSSTTGYPYIGNDGVLKYNGTVSTVVMSGTWITTDPMP